MTDDEIWVFQYLCFSICLPSFKSLGFSMSYIHDVLTLSELSDGKGLQKNVPHMQAVFNVRPFSKEAKSLHLGCHIFLKF
jgi:hypothetical protein